MDIKWIGSPNFDTNRVAIDRVVIHWIVGNLAAADSVFQKATPGTSAHYGIEDDVIHQYVKEENVAYHAGNYPMNQRSVGIEHSASPDRLASDKTYETSGKLIREICLRWKIPIDRAHIIKHSEVKATQCPGTMDLDRLISIAKSGVSTNTDTIQVDKKTFENLVHGSTEWDKTVKEYLGDIDPKTTHFEGLQKVISGFKARETELKNRIVELEKNLQAANTEIDNQKDKLANADVKCQNDKALLLAENDTLKKNAKNVDQLIGEYKGKLEEAAAKLRVKEKEVGKLKLDISQLESGKVDSMFNRVLELLRRYFT